MNKETVEKMFKGKRKTENLIVLLILMIVVVVAINYIWNGNSTNNNQTNNEENINASLITKVSNEEKNDNLETKLEEILSKIEGAGKVKVMITYSESSVTQPIYDENLKATNTIENDDSGGTRSITETDSQKQVIYKQNADGSKEPITKSILSPKVEGAIVLSQGANNATVKTNIIQAVEAATGIATHKIQVFKMEDN